MEVYLDQSRRDKPTAEASVKSGSPDSSRRGPWLQLSVPHDFEWNRYELPIASLPAELEGLRIAQVSDLHFGTSWADVYDELIGRIRSEAVDLIFVTGDLNHNKKDNRPALPVIKRFVSKLQSRLGSFGVLGNHDGYSLAGRLDGSGITYLDAKRRVLEIDGAQLELIGLPGVIRRDITPRVLASFPPKQKGIPRLVLSHFPDIIRKAKVLAPDVYFAGHSHGGQICLPGGHAIIRHDSLRRRLCKGIHRFDDTWLVVSRGLGFTGFGVRLFCPAEVIEIKLVRA
jgi:predicted MPP superfamily phosphohydrolase